MRQRSAKPATGHWPAIIPATSMVTPAIISDVKEVEVVVQYERATLHVGGVFLKIDAEQSNTDTKVEAMAGTVPDSGCSVA